jgi:hypothetical protein
MRTNILQPSPDHVSLDLHKIDLMNTLPQTTHKKLQLQECYVTVYGDNNLRRNECFSTIRKGECKKNLWSHKRRSQRIKTKKEYRIYYNGQTL